MRIKQIWHTIACIFIGMILYISNVSFAPAHPFYVSVTEITIKPAQKSIQIACKLFTDDLQDALYNLYNKQVDLTKPTAEHEQLLQRYLQERLQLKISGQSIQLSIIGFEQAQEATWCYLEATLYNQTVKEVFVNSTILCDYLPTQANLIHCKWDHVERKSYKMDCGNTSYTFSFK
jgi:hypothetical protein